MSRKIYKRPVMLKPPVPMPRKPIRSEDTKEYRRKKEEKNNFNNSTENKNNSHKLHMELHISNQQKSSHLYKSEESSSDDNSNEYEKQMKDENEIDKKKQFLKQTKRNNRSRTISPEEKKDFPLKKDDLESARAQSPDVKSKNHYLIYFFVIFLAIFFMLPSEMHKTQPQPINNDHNSLFKYIKDVRAKFHNQESDSWNDISSAINEVISRIPKVPSIILLFANETSTMDCLATELAHVSSIILHTDRSKNFNPEDFGDNVGDIINTVKEYIPPVKVMVIRDILNINAEAIKALHFLCDRVSPLVDEAIYILTMQTNNHQPSEKKLTFVEEHIRRKLSKSIDQDILMPLITRITDGAIISVQPEPNLEHCKTNLSEL